MHTSEDLAFADEVRAFVDDNLPADVRRRVIHALPVAPEARKAWHKALHARGWAAPHWPVEWGGQDWSPARAYLFSETLAEEGAPELSPFGLMMLAPTLIRYGSEAQKQAYLPGIIAGDQQWCQGFSEPGAGSDLASLRLSAVKDGEDWVLNGQKMWTTMAHRADMMFCLARTDPGAPKRQMGISMFVLPMSTPGVTVRPILLLNGRQATNEVFFDAVRLPASSLVGEVHKGWDYTRVVLGNERLNIARVGLCKRQLRLVKQLAAEAPDGAGGRMLDQPLLRSRIAAAEIDLLSIEALSLGMLAQVQKGAVPGFEANMLKIRGSEMQQRLTELLVDVRGPGALPFEADPDEGDAGAALFKSHFDTRVVSIYGGSNEIQRNIIAKGMLGLGGRGQ
ncbi:pimeloyl-CoA dehydrogenase large subunit [Brevundimonas sp. S30B]|uniref:acyl-CoA dehydrogenase family protein n=1 Tax=unclassified Brevundimonas TaxID=2622653 RepID=UPI001071D582|nr:MULTISPECIES: acyl-CoA dehydrogenase family protein [unclassified Brevundimonas]QBX36668.1 pimeloyl-CoA dehydrogenase large subunit [Brevundimonas sp. MF30-B]TFW04537.1 pimeloyl-CoA dehydrogenase large subunit [Brevundimonas sp. S30B]